MIAETTNKQYIYYLNKAKTAASTKDIFNTDKIIPAIEALRKADGTELTPKTKRNYYIALASFTKVVPKVHAIYKNAYKAINDDLKKDKKVSLPPAVPYDDLQAIGLMVMGEEDEPIENRILIGLVTQIPPVRLDYASLKIFPAIPKYYDGNYIKLGKTAKTSQFVVQRHKTEKHYGSLKRTLTPELFDVIKEWRVEHPDGTLFDTTENALGRRISSLLEKYTDKPLTMNDVRHSYVTAARKGDRSKEDVEEIAHTLGHSLSMNYDYRRD